MKKKDDGGPAFPQALSVEQEFLGSDGLSLRDYFAAHAPRKPQAWFNPTLPVPAPVPPPISLPVIEGSSAERFQTLSYLATNWRRDPCYDLANHLDDTTPTERAALAAHEDAWKDFWEQRKIYESLRDKERLTQWPYAWADAQIAERAK
jgi:hypothetical protein